MTTNVTRRAALAALVSAVLPGLVSASRGRYETPDQRRARRSNEARRARMQPEQAEVDGFAPRANYYARNDIGVHVDHENAPQERPALVEALEWWQEHAAEYAGYPVNFHIVPSREDAQLRIEVVDTVHLCGAGAYGGCALVPEARSHTPTDMEIEAGIEGDWLVWLFKHEVGHALGLKHDDEPQEIMSPDGPNN